MNNGTVDAVRGFLARYFREQLETQGRQVQFNGDLPDDYDFLLDGIVDSLGLIDLTVKLEEHFGKQIDFLELDPEQMTVVGAFCRFVAQQLDRE